MPATEYEVATPPAVDVRGFRNAHGLTQEQLGLLIGVNRFTISRWEASIRNVDNPTMLRLALEALGRRLLPARAKEKV